MKAERKLIAISGVAALFLWIIDAAVDYAGSYNSSILGVLLFEQKGFLFRFLAASAVLGVGFLAAGVVGRERRAAEREREDLILKHKDDLAGIRTLRGTLNVCASCKKIRDDRGNWDQIETYISSHSEAAFSHGLCPECATESLEEFKKIKDKNTDLMP